MQPDTLRVVKAFWRHSNLVRDVLLRQTSIFRFDLPTICNVVNLLLAQLIISRLSGNEDEGNEESWLSLQFSSFSEEQLSRLEIEVIKLFAQYSASNLVMPLTLSEGILLLSQFK